eukprot:9480009-Pyramimonas_sp.AAC.1
MKSGKLRAIIHDIMGGVARAGIRAPVPVARSARERLIGGFRELHPEGSVRGETRLRAAIAQVGPKARARADFSGARAVGLPANVSSGHA